MKQFIVRFFYLLAAILMAGAVLGTRRFLPESFLAADQARVTLSSLMLVLMILAIGAISIYWKDGENPSSRRKSTGIR